VKKTKFRFKVRIQVGNWPRAAQHNAAAVLFARARDPARSATQQALSIQAMSERRIKGELLNPRGRGTKS
jgi:hypothetical protein